MLRASLAALFLLLITPSAFAQTAPPVPDNAPSPRLRQRELTETALTSREGLEYRILVSTPSGRAPEGGFAVFYILDGDAFFNTAVEIARMREWGRLSPSIVVGVAYPSRAFYDGPRRNYDFTPPGSVDSDFDPTEIGGADRFVAFLNDELKPWVAARYPIDVNRETLFGHSLGGMFVLHAMFTSPSSFDLYLAASPTLRFSDLLIIREAEAFASRRYHASVRAAITVGELESQPPAQQVDDYRRYLTDNPEVRGGLDVEAALQQIFPVDRSHFNKARETQRMAQLLSRSGADVSFAVLEGDEHLPAGVPALLRGIPLALRPVETNQR